MVAQWQRTFYDRRYMGVHQQGCPDYVKIAQAYGAEGVRGTVHERIRKGYKNST